MIPRQASRRLGEALDDTPVVLVQGPRQCGKSTLAETVAAERGMRRVTLDDPLALDAALRNPTEFLAANGPALLVDEVQRAPDLFLAIKRAVDRDRRPGRFLLTGSANVLLLPKIADSLAGRMEIVPLWPFSEAEIEGTDGDLVESLFSVGPLAAPPTPPNLDERLLRGGFPEPVSRSGPSRRQAWFAAYAKTLVERDVRDLANIEGLNALPRLLRLIAARSGETLNLSSLSRETGVPHTTLTRYVSLLEAAFLIVQVPPFSFDGGQRLIKTPRAYLSDSGLLGHFLGADPRRLAQDEPLRARLLGTFVAMTLRKALDASDTGAALHHLRTVKTHEVEFVLEHPDGRMVGLTVVPVAHPAPRDLRGLEFLRELAGDRFHRGVLLHLGEAATSVAPGIAALPIGSLWTPPAV
ncbi:MAG: ATP-binding protein [Fimbriimonadaceae bacterium]|nr:ATP-binding protein [Fimbriimonadaceae bacterium]